MGIDAALFSGSRCYFFSGDRYLRVTRGDTGRGTVDPGYPQSISAWGWPDGFGAGGIDAALFSGSRCYFFAGDRYLRVTRGDTGRGTVDPGYPRDISAWGWPDGFGSGTGTDGGAAVRREIWGLEASTPWDDVTLWYARAVAALQARPLSDPTSWEYLSAVHGRRGPVPPEAVWNQCQHGSWFFLSWHRMYVYFFEQIVRAAVVAQGGPGDWALPYWDYSAPERAALPPAFRERTLPDGTPNPLRIPQRARGINAGAQLPPSATTSVAAMAATTFTPPPEPGFGGGRTSPQQFFGAAGELEFVPHNIVHSLIGGFMGDANTAALDPVFWLHHCNVDRLWEQWLGAGGGRANPADEQWRTTAFPFHDAQGNPVSLRGADVLDTAGQLGYRYEGAPPPAPMREAVVMGDAGPGGVEPEMVGASERPVELSGSSASVGVVMDPRAAAQTRFELRGEAEGEPAAEHVYLHLEDIEGERNPALGYEVFVRCAPPGRDAATHYVGNVSFFGIEHMSARGPDVDGPHGLRRTFDITALVEQMRARGEWDEESLAVTFEPLRLLPPPAASAEPEPADEEGAAPDEAAAAEAENAPVRIGRVSVSLG